jgi:F-type H+-transporting ATPase subunit epsilon
MSESTNETFEFELVSPEKKLLSEPAKMVVVPGEEGDFGVLWNHAATVSSIRSGVLTVFSNDNEDPMKIFVAGGFADVTPKSCTVLAEEAIMVSDLEQDNLEQELKNLTEDLGLVEGDADKLRVEKKIEIVQAKLSAVTGSLIL